ncbi:MAG: inositol monophosphatase family protein [Pseudomonadota bacterium]
MDFMHLAVQAAREGGRMARFHAGRVTEVGQKKDRADLVTAIDREVETRLREILLGACPDHAFFGEEHGARGEGRHRWLVDPIDGTLNFVSGFPYYCTSVALEVDGAIEVAALYDPERDELFTARRGHGAWLNGAPIKVTSTARLQDAMLATGYNYRPDEDEVRATMQRVTRVVARSRAVRRVGAAALDLAYVAAGRFDGFWEGGLNPWDVAAAWLLVEEAGGRMSDLDGAAFALNAPLVVASNGVFHDELLGALCD